MADMAKHQEFIAMVAGKSNSAPGRKLDRSKYVGVSMKEYGEHDFIWQVTINQEGKVRHLGYFDDEKTAQFGVAKVRKASDRN